jgi:hypothetical protein
MWPREVFDILAYEKNLALLEDLRHPGVYILYRDDTPYYIGRTERSLSDRLYDHANKSADAYFNFWNYFSAFVVPDRSHLKEVEGVLIASVPTANRAVPDINKIPMPKVIVEKLREARRAHLPKREI